MASIKPPCPKQKTSPRGRMLSASQSPTPDPTGRHEPPQGAHQHQQRASQIAPQVAAPAPCTARLVLPLVHHSSARPCAGVCERGCAGGRAGKCSRPVSRTQAAGAFERGGTWQPRQPRAAAGYLHTRGSGGVISRGSTLLCGRQVSGAPGAHKVALPKGDACSTPTCPAVGGR